MAQINLEGSAYISWLLSPEEELHGQVFTTSQKHVLQNELCIRATELLNLEFDPLNPLKFAQTQAGLQGEIKLLTYLLARSEESASVILTNASN